MEVDNINQMIHPARQTLRVKLTPQAAQAHQAMGTLLKFQRAFALQATLIRLKTPQLIILLQSLIIHQLRKIHP